MKAFLAMAVSLLTAFGVVEVMAAPQMMTLPKGTSVQKLGPGYFRFTLPDGRKIEVHGLNPGTGAIIGDCGVYDPAGKKLSSGQGGSLRGAGKLARERAATLPRSEYVQIDDEVTWLPAVFQCQTKGATQLSPQPDPPGLRAPFNPQAGSPGGGKNKLGDPDPPLGRTPPNPQAGVGGKNKVIDPDPPMRAQ